MGRIGQDAINLALFGTICFGAHFYHHLFKKTKLIETASPSTRNKKSLYVITGCDSGFGNLLSKQLAKQSDVVVVSLCLTAKACDELKTLGIRAIQCDVTKDEDVQRMKDMVTGLIDDEKLILTTIVNNAGTANPGDFVFYNDLKPVKDIMEVNFFGMLRVTQALLPLLLQTSPVFGGRILNISSVCGTTASPGNSAYNASKFAVEAWSDSLRLELKAFNIKVVKIRPGQFSTSIQSIWGERFLENYQNSSDQVKSIYGGSSHGEKISNTLLGSKNSVADPMDAVNDISNLVSANLNKLEPYYWIGNDANTFWKALIHLPTNVADSLKCLITISPDEKALPPVNVTSHVTICVSDLDKSIPFYEAFGLKKHGERLSGQQFLKSGSSTKWATLVLLKEDKTMGKQGESYNAGMRRLCIYSNNAEAEGERLKKAGLKQKAPTAHDSMALISAFEDPDGFIVYLIQFKGFISSIVKAMFWWRKQTMPWLFHWTINTTDVKAAMKGFELLGYKTMSNQNKDQVANDLLPAFNIDPDSTEIEFIRLCSLPSDTFVATLMQWNNPKTEKTETALYNSLTISVDDVDYALEEARKAGFTTKEEVEFREFPVYGKIPVGTFFVEPKSAPVEVACFSHKC